MPTRPILAQPITSPEGLRAVKDAAGAYRPPTWVAALEETRLQYEGEVAPSVAREVKRRYPATGDRMPKVAFQWTSTVAFKGSTVYDTPTTRLLNGTNGPLPAESDAVVAFNALIGEARLSAKMPEFDRVRYLAHSAVLHVRSDSVAAMARGTPPPTVVDIVWPQDLFVIPHPNAPTDLQAALRVLWRTGDAAGVGVESYVDWYRDYAVDEFGRITSLGVWQADLITLTRTSKTTALGFGQRVEESLQVTPLWRPYPLRRLPFFVAHKGTPAGMPFMRFPSGVAAVANTINGSIASELHTVDQTAAPVLALKTARDLPGTVVGGPGALFKLLPGEDLDSVTQTADLPGIRATNDALLEMLALTERQRPGAFTGDDGNDSGVALKVKSIPSEKARREDKETLRPFEAEEFLPGLIEVHDYFRGTRIAAATTSIVVDFPDPPDFETKGERQTRLVEAVEMRWITDARAAVEAGYYRDEQEAQAAIDKARSEASARMTSVVPIDNAPPREGTDASGDDSFDDDEDDVVDDNGRSDNGRA